MVSNTRTLIKSALLSNPNGLKVIDLAQNIGVPYPNAYQVIKNMEADGQVKKVCRGTYSISETPSFSTQECIALLQSLQAQEQAVVDAQAQLDRAEAQLSAIKRTIRSSMLNTFND